MPPTIIRRPVEGTAKVCDNKTSATLSAEVGGKFAQEYQHGSKTWREMCGRGRNSVESACSYPGVGVDPRAFLRPGRFQTPRAVLIAERQ